MKKLRICMISSEFPPHSAGIGSSVYSLSKALVKRGHIVTVLTRGKPFRETKRFVDGICVIELPFIAFPPPWHLAYHGYFVNRKLAEMKNDFDLIHLNTPLVPKIKSHLPKIVQVHSLWLEETKHFDNAKDLYSIAVRVFKNQVIASEQNTLKQAHTIILYSEHEKKTLESYKINMSNLAIINGAIDTSKLNLKKTNKEYDVVFVGRLNPRKGIEEIIKAAIKIKESLSSVSFLIIGSGNSRKWMEKQIEKNDLQINFTFLGFINNKGVLSCMRKSRICIVPSRYEPFGIVTGEAMASGLPVVGTKTGGTESMVKNSVTGCLTEIRDYKAMARNIVELLNNPKKASQMGIRGRHRIIKYFNKLSVAIQYESIYMKII